MSRVMALVCVLCLTATASAGFIVMPNGAGTPGAVAEVTLTPSQLVIDLILADATGINSPLIGVAAGVTLVGGGANFTGLNPAGTSTGWTVAAENFILTPPDSWREQIEYGNVIAGLWGPDSAPGTGDEPVPTGDTYQFGMLKESTGTPQGTNGQVSTDGQSISHTVVGGYPEGGTPGNPLEGFAPQVGAVLARFVFTNNTGVDEAGLGDVEIYFHKDGMNNGVPDYGPNGPGDSGVQLLTQDSTNPILGVVPEPATMGLLGLGLVGLVARRKK